MKPYFIILTLASLVTAQSEIRFLGRVNPETGELSWPGTGISFAFTGTSATIGVVSKQGSSSVELVVDGEPIVIANVDGDISTPEGLAEGNHTVVLHKRSGQDFGSIFIGEVTTDGILVSTEPRERQIEVIGDSISVGYGIDGMNPCVNSAEVENVRKTYGVLAAEALDADYSIVAWSGRGLTRNYVDPSLDNTPVMPELYTRYGANDPANSYTFPKEWSPNAVVINLGTNDWGYLNIRDPMDPAVFTEAMVEFVQTIQGHYPNATFFFVTSPMLNDDYPTVEDAQHSRHAEALENVISKIGDGNMHLLDWPAQGLDVGCDYHPNAATHAAQAEVLARAIAAELDW